MNHLGSAPEPGAESGVLPPMSATCVLALFLASAPLRAQESPPALPWDAERAEHLWNRAGFGANGAGH